LGGEPTLYPALNEAIAFVKSKERFCQLLTNGLRFTQPGGADYLDRLKACGIDRILLHIDESQATVRSTYVKDQEVIAGLCNERHIHCGLSLTLFPGQPATIPGSVRRLSGFAYFDGCISVLAQDPHNQDFWQHDLLDQYKALRDGLAISPQLFITGSIDRQCVTWLFYYFLINSTTGKTYRIPVGVVRFSLWLYRLLKGREFFTDTIEPVKLRMLLGFTMPWLHNRDTLRFQFVVIQRPPRKVAHPGVTEFCRRCPDATVRNGKLVPVCVADMAAPWFEEKQWDSSQAERINKSLAGVFR
jgi:hypothetical protein